MKNKTDKLNIYTDLALENAEMILKGNAREEKTITDGVEMETEYFEDIDVSVTTVRVLNGAGAKKIGKLIGTYITIESDSMKGNEVEAHEEIIKILSEKIGVLHRLNKNSTVLIIGLGNWNVTPDALGPKVVSKILVTRHIMETLPDDLENSVRSICALSPGVMGMTGIETAEVVRGLVDRVKPDLVIAVDALAARRTSRINATIQLCDTGINPGAGMGNSRMRMNKETLGVDVIGIGVPTVVDAATLVNDTMDLMLSSMLESVDKKSDSAFYDMLAKLESEEKYQMVKEILDPCAGNMFVTPKEVDSTVEHLSNIIANSLNIALHPGISKEDINRYMY